jgi:hypothetical protein
VGVKRKQPGPQFTAQVAMAGLSGEKTMAELSAELAPDPVSSAARTLHRSVALRAAQPLEGKPVNQVPRQSASAWAPPWLSPPRAVDALIRRASRRARFDRPASVASIGLPAGGRSGCRVRN